MHIPPDHIVPELRAKERYAVVRELLQHLASVGAIPHHATDSMFQTFRRRPEITTAAVAFGVATPHIASDAVTERVLALGQSSTGVEFFAIDDQPVTSVVLTISPPHLAPTDYITIPDT